MSIRSDGQLLLRKGKQEPTMPGGQGPFQATSLHFVRNALRALHQQALELAAAHLPHGPAPTRYPVRAFAWRETHRRWHSLGDPHGFVGSEYYGGLEGVELTQDSQGDVQCTQDSQGDVEFTQASQDVQCTQDSQGMSSSLKTARGAKTATLSPEARRPEMARTPKTAWNLKITCSLTGVRR